MNQPPPKKRKADENNNIKENRMRAVQAGLWHDDGNIILIAEDTPFKVHKSMLSKKSEIFRDMFSLPQPATLDESELMDGIPAVSMSDSWIDLRCILLAIYDGYQTFGTSVALSLPTISAFLRLGTKYGLTDFYESAVSRLNATFPSTLDLFMKKMDTALQECRVIDKLGTTIIMTSADAIVAINLARAHNISSILPAAFYTCSRLPPKILVEGVKDADGNRSVLSPEDLARCWAGQQTLDRLYAVAIQSLRFEIGGRLCESSDRCFDFKGYDTQEDLYKHMGCCFGSASHLDMDIGDDLCLGCVKARASAWTLFQKETWDSLLDIFDLKDSTHG
ncbi:hypothetical protein QCA50_005644 [Cerrena zonata]|uniref:BTB domain-containing protein n=1 Tax=Cerrena zonata TaxID=2478898 RepID=A0AAW0GAX6_9APHY